MLVHSGVLSIYCFLIASSSSVILLVQFIDEHVYSCLVSHLYWILPVHYIFLNISIRALTKGFSYQVAVRASFLGFIFSLGLFVSSLAGPTWNIFGWYLCFMAFFHYSEFLTIALTNPRTLTISSFILNHSLEYQIAAVTSWIEFFIELWLFPGLKSYRFVSLVGLTLCIGGESLRKLAMFTARTNFNHVVQNVHKDDHRLITNGIYAIFRHPSYVGWFYWSVGTQLVLVNPACIVGYALASLKFFYDRVTIEEMTLLSFFGQDYVDYQKAVPTGLPFIHGYSIEMDFPPSK